MPLKEPITAYVFRHDRTWDYVCRHCMNEGETVNMEAVKSGSAVTIRCPRCGTNERIDEDMQQDASYGCLL